MYENILNPLQQAAHGVITPFSRPIYRAAQSGYKPAAPTEPEQSDAPVESGDPGVLRKIGSTAISGVGATGNLLDLPGSTIRDFATWLPGGTKAQNPFDQWLDPFGKNADKNRVEGRQLLREAGMIGKKDTWGNFVGGLALEMALDPTTYIGLPAASKMGKAFEVAGLGNKQLKAVVKEIAEDTGAKGFKSGRSWGMNTTGKRILDHMAKSRDTIASAVAKERKMKLIKEPFSSFDSLPKTAEENALALLDEGGAYSLYKYSPDKKGGAGWVVDDDSTELFRGKMGTRALGDKTYNGVKATTEGYYNKKYREGYEEALSSQPMTSFVSFKAPFLESTRKDLLYDKTPDISFAKRMGKQGVDLDGTMGGATPPPPKPPRTPKPKGGPGSVGPTAPGVTPTPQVPVGAATSAASKVALELTDDVKKQLRDAQLTDEEIADFKSMDEVNEFLNPDPGGGIPTGDMPKEGDTLPPTTGTAPTPQTPPPGPAGGGGTPGASVNAPDLNVTSAAAEQVSGVTKPSTGVKSEARAAGGDVAKDAGKVPTFEDVATTLKVVDGTARGKRIKELFGIRGAQESLVNIPIMDAAMKTLAKGVKGGEDALWERISFREFDDQKELQKVIKDAGGVEKLFQAAYHGTPHTFKSEALVTLPDGTKQYVDATDIPEGATVEATFPMGRFTVKKIGSGEGAQAYGWGLYFAEGEDIARWYRDKLSKAESDPHALYYGKVKAKVGTAAGLVAKEMETNLDGAAGAIKKVANDLELSLSKGGAEGRAGIFGRLQYQDPKEIQSLLDEVSGLDPQAFKRNNDFIVDIPKTYSEESRRIIENWLNKHRSTEINFPPSLGLTAIERPLARHLRASGWDEAADGVISGDIKIKRFKAPGEGDLLKVDLKPADDEYLLYDKSFGEQSEKVKNAILEATSDEAIQAAKEARDTLEKQFEAELDELGDLQNQLYFSEGHLERRRGDDLSGLNLGAGSTKGALASRIEELEAATKPLNEATDNYNRLVQLKRTITDWDEKVVVEDVPARTIAHTIANSEKGAKFLRDLGVRGIKFLDGTSRRKGAGRHNFVIFDDNDVEVVEKLFQGKQSDARGAILTQNSKSLVALFAGKSDASTVMHEFAHFARRYLPSEMSARAAAGVKKLINKNILDENGGWTEEAEEAFARAWERYLREGESPTKSLRNVFRAMKSLMQQVYKGFLKNELEINPELKVVFDELLGKQPKVPKAKKAAVDAQGAAGVAAAAGGVLDNVAGDAAKAVDNVAPVDDVTKTMVEDMPPDVNATSSVDDVTNTADDVVDDATKTEVVDETKVETPPPSAAETLVNKSKAVSDDATTNQAGKPVSDDPMRAAVDTLGDGDAIKELIYKALHTPNTASLKALGITGRAATDVLRLLDKPLKDKTAESLAEAAEIISLRHTLPDATPAVRDVKPKGLAGDSVSPIDDVAKTADNVVDDATKAADETVDDVTKAADETVDDVTKVETPPPSAAEELVNKSKAVSDDAATAENALIKESAQATDELAGQMPDNPLITIANKELDDAVDMHVSAAAAEIIADMKNGSIDLPKKPDEVFSSVAENIIRRIHEEVPDLDVNNVDNNHIINRIKGTQEGIAQQVRDAAKDAIEAQKKDIKNGKERAKRAASGQEAPKGLSDAQIQENEKLGKAKWNENLDVIVLAANRAAKNRRGYSEAIKNEILEEAYRSILKNPQGFDMDQVLGWMYDRARKRELNMIVKDSKKIGGSAGAISESLSRNYKHNPKSTEKYLDELLEAAGITDADDIKAARAMFLHGKKTAEAATEAEITPALADAVRKKLNAYIRKAHSGKQEGDVDGLLLNNALERTKSATAVQRQAIDEEVDKTVGAFRDHLEKTRKLAGETLPERKSFIVRKFAELTLKGLSDKDAALEIVSESMDNAIRNEFMELFPDADPITTKIVNDYVNEFRAFTNSSESVKSSVTDTIDVLFQRRNKKAAQKINDEGKDFVSKINSGAKQQPNTTQAARAAVNSIDDYELKLQMLDSMDVGEHLFFSNPIIRRAATLFDRTVLGGHTEQGQELARKQSEAWTRATFVFRRQLTGLVRAIGETKLFSEHEIMKEYADLGADAAREKARDILNQRHNEFLRYMERDSHELNTTLFADQADRELLSGQLDLLKEVMPQELRRDALAGMNTPDVNDEYINYWARYWYKGHTKTAKKARGEKVVEVGAEHHKARAKHTKNLPGGTATLNEISIDRNISGKYWDQDTLGIGFKDLIDNDGKKMKAYDYIREKYGKDIFGDRDFKMKDGVPVFDKSGKQVLSVTGRRKLKGITEMALHMPPVHAQKQIPMYGNNFIHDFAKRVEEGYARRGVALAAQEMAARNAGKGKQMGIEQFMKDIKTDNAQAFKNVISGSGNMDEYLKFLDKKIASLDKLLADKGIKTKNGVLKEIDGKIYRVTDEGQALIEGDKVDVLENLLNIPKEFAGDEKGIKLTVDNEVYEEAMRFLKPWNRPQEVGDFMRIMQSTLNWFKTHVTIPFPSFHGRNFISGQIMNYFYDAFDPTAFGPNRYAKPIKQAFMLRSGHVVKGLYSEMPEWVQKDIKRQYNNLSNLDEAASHWVQDNVFTYGLTGDKQGYAAERIGDSASSTITQMPGAAPPTGFMGLLNKAAPGTKWFDRINPFHIRGGGKPVRVPKDPSAAGALAAKANPTDQKRWKTIYDSVFGEREWDKYDETTFLPVAIGEDMAVLTEDVNRIAPFLAFVKQGIDPAVAARKVQNIHFDYSDLSEFEKGLRNIFPFMTFTRKVIPLTFHDLATNPGGKQAWAIRASTRAQDPDLSAPDNVLRSTAIPLGQTESGADQYITGLGLPYEDALSFTGALQGDWQGTVGEIVSRMRPEIQGAAELATGQSTFFGKPLSDLDPPVGRLAQNIYETATGVKSDGQAAPIAGSRGVEFLLRKLPTSRYINTANNMLDQRDSIGEKALAGLTGIKVQNVEPWMKDRTSLTRATDVLREYGGRTMEMPYVPEWAKNRLSESERQDVDALQSFIRDVQKTGRQRKKEAEALAASLENAED